MPESNSKAFGRRISPRPNVFGPSHFHTSKHNKFYNKHLVGGGCNDPERSHRHGGKGVGTNPLSDKGAFAGVNTTGATLVGIPAKGQLILVIPFPVFFSSLPAHHLSPTALFVERSIGGESWSPHCTLTPVKEHTRRQSKDAPSPPQGRGSFAMDFGKTQQPRKRPSACLIRCGPLLGQHHRDRGGDMWWYSAPPNLTLP